MMTHTKSKRLESIVIGVILMVTKTICIYNLIKRHQHFLVLGR